MGAKKSAKPRAARAGAEARAFTVVLEDMRAQFGVFGEALQGLHERMDRGFEEMNQRFEQIDRRFEQVDARFEQIDRRFEQVDRRFDQIDGRFAQVEGRLGGLERDVGLLKTAVLENGREIREVRAALANKVDRAEVEAIVEGVLARR